MLSSQAPLYLPEDLKAISGLGERLIGCLVLVPMIQEALIATSSGKGERIMQTSKAFL